MRSRPAPPVSRSLPGPPRSTSAPVPPRMISPPPPPVTTSRPGPPSSTVPERLMFGSFAQTPVTQALARTVSLPSVPLMSLAKARLPPAVRRQAASTAAARLVPDGWVIAGICLLHDQLSLHPLVDAAVEAIGLTGLEPLGALDGCGLLEANQLAAEEGLAVRPLVVGHHVVLGQVVVVEGDVRS